MVEAGRACGLDALALTDHNLAAAVPFAQQCRGAGMRPIHGLCLECRAVLVAKDPAGLRAVQRISTRQQLAGEKRDCTGDVRAGTGTVPFSPREGGKA